MHITLINPSVPRPTFDSTHAQLPPLGILYIAAVLEKHGHTVTVIDAELFCYGPLEVAERIPAQTECVGLGGTSFQAQEAFAIATLVRARFPGCSVIYGGPHACALAYEVFTLCRAVDHVILGPGEIPVLALANGENPEHICGCLSRGQIALSSPAFAEPLPFAEQPLPARHLVPLRAYPGAGRLPFTQTSMMITRGCPFRCMFCSGTVWGKQWSRRDAADIVAELKLLRDAGFTEIFFQDDTINVDVQWAHHLFGAIKDAGLGLRYKLCLRVNEKMLPETLLACMAGAGVGHVFFGVESANDAVRATASKGIAKAEVRRAVALAKKYNIDTTLAFIVGLPGETEETVTESMQFVKELQPYEAGFSTAVPFPGTPLRTWAVENGFLEDDRPEALRPGRAIMRTEALSCREIEQLRHKAEHETAPFTTRSANTAEAQCDHLIATLLDFERRSETVPAVPFVMLALARASLDVTLGWEPCICQTQRLLGGELSACHRAKAQAMLGWARARFGDIEQAVASFYAAESAGFPEVSVWCREQYAALGWDECNLLPPHTAKPVPPRNLAAFTAALQQPDAYTELFSAGLPEDVELLADGKHKAFASPESLLDALYRQPDSGKKRLVWINGAFSRPAAEADTFAMLRNCRAVSGANTLWVFSGGFGPQFGDSLRNQPKHISRGRALELAVMAGFRDVTNIEACLIAVRGLHQVQRIDPSRLLALRDSMTDTEYRRYVLDAHEKIQCCLASMDGSASDAVRENMAALVADNTYDLLLRYACAATFGLEDRLYADSRVVDYHAFGQWQLDYAVMVRDALNLRGEKLLDFGCAFGSHVLGFRMAGIDACGVDVNQTFLHNALPSVAGQLRHFPATDPFTLLKMFPPRSFAAITATEVFEHVPHDAKKEYVRIFAQLLAPGGSCIITCPTGEQEFENVHGGGVFCDPQHGNLMTDTQIADLFTVAGFEDTSDDYRIHVRTFRGKDGFSFWRTYCSFNKYFCFRMPAEGGEGRVRTLRHARGLMVLPPAPGGSMP
jgi:radical SAM superfamily enzyme YgiQ (UPF0313 family)/SAM-dependent methyltransferase